jgi:hypothetical protein
MTYTVTSFGKAFAHVRNCLLKKAHVIDKNIDGFYAKDCMPLNGVTLPSNIVLATYSYECGKYELVAASVKSTMYNL